MTRLCRRRWEAEVRLQSIRSLRARRGHVVIATTPRFTPGNEPMPIVQEVAFDSGPIWKCTENLVPTGVRSQIVKPVVSRHID